MSSCCSCRFKHWPSERRYRKAYINRRKHLRQGTATGGYQYGDALSFFDSRDDELKNVLLLDVCIYSVYVRDCTLRRYMLYETPKSHLDLSRINFRLSIYPLLRNCLLNLGSAAPLFITRIYEIYPQIFQLRGTALLHFLLC